MPTPLIFSIAAVAALAAGGNADHAGGVGGPKAVPVVGQHSPVSFMAAPQTRGPANTGRTTQISGTASETKVLFDTYCGMAGSNNDRVTQVLASGRFGKMQTGKLPLAGYEDMVFVFYKLRGSAPQIGFGARPGGGQYCIAVDGTRKGTEYYITDQ